MPKTLLTIAAILSTAVVSRAELSPEAFAELKSYAESQGQFYLGLSATRDDNGKAVYYWRFGDKDGTEHAYVFGRYVFTARDAIIAFQTSDWTQLLVNQANLKNLEHVDKADEAVLQKDRDACAKQIIELQNKITELQSELRATKTGRVE